MELTETRKNPHGIDKIIARYALDPWFKDPVNLAKLVFKDAIWWCQDAIVVPSVGIFCKYTLLECHDFLIKETWILQRS